MQAQQLPRLHLCLRQQCKMDTTTHYKNILTDLIKKQMVALGTEVALKQAREVAGFTVADDGTVTEIASDPQTVLSAVAVVFHDLSAYKRLEKLREEFTAMMIHELRTPLTTVIYSIDMMSTDLPKMTQDQIRQNLNLIKSETSNMLTLVNELLDVAKVEAGKFTVAKKADDLVKLINEKIADFTPLAEQKHLVISSKIDLNLNKISFDNTRMGEVLNNLLSNAIKYTPSGQVTVTAQVKDNGVTVSVADTGEGLAEQDLPKLFSKFEQISKNGGKGGTGLGLVIAKGIVEAHGGKISASSDGLGKGTTFTFTLPMA